MITRRMLTVSGLALAACGGRSMAQPAQPLAMSGPRACHGMVSLADGAVLLIGGCSGTGCETGPSTSTVDRFDPATGRISRIGALRRPRVQMAVSLLRDGGVLLAGGWSDGRLSDTLERFDPRTGQSEDVGRMGTAQGCLAVGMADGRVLLVGESAIEAYDPQKAAVTQISQNSVYSDSSTVTLLNTGRVLIAGGGIHGPPRSDAFLLDPRTGKSEPTGSLSAPRRKHAAVRLLDGRVLIVGGSDVNDRGGKTKRLEVYDPASGKFSSVGEMLEARFKIPDAAVRLADGRVLVAGGADSPEVIDPATWRSRPVDVSLGATLNFSAAAALPNGDVLVAGGYSERGIMATARAWIIPKAAMA